MNKQDQRRKMAENKIKESLGKRNFFFFFFLNLQILTVSLCNVNNDVKQRLNEKWLTLWALNRNGLDRLM